MISRVDLAHNGTSRAKEWRVSVDYGTIIYLFILFIYLTCIMISRVDLAHYAIFRAEDWRVSVDFGTFIYLFIESFQT